MKRQSDLRRSPLFAAAFALLLAMVLFGGSRDSASASAMIDAAMTVPLTDLSVGGVILKKAELELEEIGSLVIDLEDIEISLSFDLECEKSFAWFSVFLNFGDEVESLDDLDLSTGIVKKVSVLSRKGCRSSVDISAIYAGMIEDGVTSLEVIIADDLLDGDSISLLEISGFDITVRGVLIE